MAADIIFLIGSKSLLVVWKIMFSFNEIDMLLPPLA
jgi:hypothetical protein